MQKLRLLSISLVILLLAVFPAYSGGTREKDGSGSGTTGATAAAAGESGQVETGAGSDFSDPEKPAPVDEQVRLGRLPNGLVYYIRENGKPAGRAELRLVVNAGSILEDDDQQGLAHFVEHMAFNGTAHFSKNSLIDYLESIGMEFGPEINAYTSFDETVYMLHVPTKNGEVFRNAFLILSDWAGGYLFDPQEVEKERGVIVEEWRQGRGADARILDKQLPVIFGGSRYAVRLPIGRKETIESFPHEALKRFYRDWYRPDLMAVVAVGDFKADDAEALIRELFSDLPSPAAPRDRAIYPAGRTETPVYAIATDPEATYAVASLYFKRDPEREVTVGDYRRILLNMLVSTMMNDRLAELTERADPPYAAAYCAYVPFVRSSDAFIAQALASTGGLLPAFSSIAEEAFRAREHGFTAEELERAKKNLYSLVRQQYRERDKTESASFASQYVTHYLKGTMIPSISWELAAVEALLPGIGLAEVNALVSSYVTTENLAVLIDAPEKEGFPVPTEAELASVLSRFESGGTAAYAETDTARSLLDAAPKPGVVKKRERVEAQDATLLTLSNGIRVLLKRTENKDDQILLRSFSFGGLSRISDADYVSGLLTVDFAVQSGVGPFSRTGLDRFLAGKQVQVSPYLDVDTEGFSGYSSAEDFPLMLELIHAYATRFKIDPDAYTSLMTRYAAVLENQMAMPETKFSHRFQTLLYGGHPRMRPMTPELLREADRERALRVYQDRFSDLGDSVFVIVGSVDIETAVPLIETYLGSLLTKGRRETVTDRGIRYAGKGISESVYAGIEEKSAVILAFSGPAKWSEEEEFRLQALSQALTIRLREVLREDEGGTYGVGVGSSLEKLPAGQYLFRIVFFCSPDRVDELTGLAREELARFRGGSVDAALTGKVREIMKAAHERNLESNDYILSLLVGRFIHELPLDKADRTGDLIERLAPSDISAAARRYLDESRLIDLSLFPASRGGEGR